MQPANFQIEYARVSEFLNRFAVRLTQDSSAAKDLVQETTYRALSNCERFEPGTNFKAWIATIMRNTFISAYRKRRRAPQYVGTVAAVAECKQPRAINAGPSNLSLREMEAKLRRLSPIYAEPFTLYYSGYRYEEIAQLMDLPLGTVKSRIFTARKRLKSMLREQL